MKALPKILLALTGVAALSLAHPASANLITNPGFETGDFTGWSSFCAFCSVDATNPHSGQYAAVLRDECCADLFQPVNLASGQDYILSFWLASPDSGSLFIVINGDFVDETFGAFDYTQFIYHVEGMGPTTLFFNFGGPLYLDDVSLTPAVPEPFSTLWMALLFAGMVAFRRLRPERG
jgi:hypothetical protein